MAINELLIYDRAVHAFFQVNKADDGTPIPSVFATPQRAFAALMDLYQLDPKDPKNKVPLPATALHRGNPTFDPTRYRFTDRWVNSYDKPPTHDKVNVMGPPQTILIDYSLEIWTYTSVEMLSIVKQLSMKFRGELAYIVVDLAEYGKKRFSIKDGGIQDASVLEPQEEERMLRMTMNVTLSAVLHRPLELVPTVLTVDLETRDETTDALLGTIEVTRDG